MTNRKRTFTPPEKGRYSDEGKLANSGLWWWRCLDFTSGPQEFTQFTEVWERSAFFYEFRARLHSKKRLPLWEGFLCPWWDLDQTQRGILYYLWPPDIKGSYWPFERQRQVSDYLRFMIKVDFAQPLDQVLEDVRKIWKGLESELVHLWGIGETGDANFTDEPKSAAQWKLDGKWTMLEALDRKKHFGGKLPPDARTTLHRQLEKYVNSCQQAGISP